MAAGKKTFIFYSDWTHMINEMPNEDAGELLKHILSYVNDEDPLSENLLVKMAFGHMKPLLKKDLEKWDKRLEQFSEMGKKSAEKRAALKVQPTLTYVEHTPTVNDNDNVNNKETNTSQQFKKELIEFAEKFYDALVKYKITKTRPKTISKRNLDDLRLLNSKDGFSWVEINEIASYYFTVGCPEAGGLFVIESLTSFREKRNKLKAAIVRLNNQE